ncbi:kelch repeat protein [Teladorsagia circumcincta]|uniref:Kelch repeat protein n=1 Tax=Teladorsagia circumcincta TaxID=45464 RepID=A0A2G9T8S5_TELCI|nr:kelch repeat protein [Teladorsagia circumcincta]
MSTRRRRLGSAVLNGYLYAVGGEQAGNYGDFIALSSVEKYNPATNEWTSVDAMKKKRYGLGVAVVNQMLLAVGGNDRTSDLDTVEAFDPKTNKWKNHSCMNDGLVAVTV